MKPLNFYTFKSYLYGKQQFKNTTCLICPHLSRDLLCDKFQCIQLCMDTSKVETLLFLLEKAHEDT